MINLIPPRAKKALVAEYWFRVASVWLYLWAFALFAGGCLLLPAYVLIGSQVNVYATSVEEASEKVANYETVSTALVRSSQEARVLLDAREERQFSEYIALFRALQEDTIVLSEVRLSKSASGFAPATLSGVATDRQALASFRDRVLALPEVATVDFPISNLTQGSNIDFSLTVSLISPEEL